MIPHKLSQKVQNDENIYINRENQKKCGSICKNSVINIKNPIILLIKIINKCTLSNQHFFSFENNSTKHRSAQSINQFKFEGLTKKTTNLTKIYQPKTKFNQYNNRRKQKSRNCKNKWEIREKGSQTFQIFFFPSVCWSGTEHANSKKRK